MPAKQLSRMCSGWEESVNHMNALKTHLSCQPHKISYNDWMHLFHSLQIRWPYVEHHNEISITWEWIPCGIKNLVCIFSAGGKISHKWVVHYCGDWWFCKIRAYSFYLAGYKLGKCNGMKKLHFEYRFKYYIQP